MRLSVAGRPHLTYCTNVHAGETAQDVHRHIATHVVDVKHRVSPNSPFGVGLRVSAVAAKDLLDGNTLRALKELLQDNDLYVFSINGFPYGSFHGERVKERVYQPDWTTEARLAYSDALARLLAQLLPEDVAGSISSVPGGFRSALGAEATIAARLVQHAVTLFRIRQETGRIIELSLEPEPGCLLETTDEAIRFFDRFLFRAASVRAFAQATALGSGDAEAALRRHLGVCFDTCHAAVQFESPRDAFAKLASAGVRIGKVQISAGLEIPSGVDEEAERRLRVALRGFSDEVYLHQVVERQAAGYRRFLDLPDALADTAGRSRGDWRIHFHVPVFHAELAPFRSTQPFLRDALRCLTEAPATEHWEVETYTWDVLPAPYRTSTVDDAIARELGWVLDEVQASERSEAEEPVGA